LAALIFVTWAVMSVSPGLNVSSAATVMPNFGIVAFATAMPSLPNALESEMSASFFTPLDCMYSSSNGRTRVLLHGVWKTSLSNCFVMTVAPAMDTCGMAALSISPRIAIVWPLPVAPRIASTLSWATSFVVAAAAFATSVPSSSMTTSIGCPLTPPAALMRATSMPMTFFSGVPRPAYVPVSESTAPSLYSVFVAVAPPVALGVGAGVAVHPAARSATSDHPVSAAVARR
jgi:hypothetical protein